jgi:hypothetical protein
MADATRSETPNALCNSKDDWLGPFCAKCWSSLACCSGYSFVSSPFCLKETHLIANAARFHEKIDHFVMPFFHSQIQSRLNLMSVS